MRLRAIIQWGFLVFLVGIFIFFEAIHLQVLHYNMFLLFLLLISFIGIMCLWMLEKDDFKSKQ